MNESTNVVVMGSNGARCAMVLGAALLGLTAAPALAFPTCEGTVTERWYEASVRVEWDLVYDAGCVDANGSAHGLSIATVLANGDCDPCTTHTSIDPDSSGYGPLPQLAGTFAGVTCPIDTWHARADYDARAAADGYVDTFTYAYNVTSRCDGDPTCESLCVILGLPGGRASTNMDFTTSGSGCSGSPFESVTVTAHVDVRHWREYTTGINCGPAAPEEAAGGPTGNVNSHDQFASFIVTYGDAGGTLGTVVHQGIVNMGRSAAILEGSLFDDGGTGVIGHLGTGWPTPCPWPLDCGDDYEGEVTVTIPVALPSNATWVSISAAAQPIEDIGPDVNRDGVVSFDDRVALTAALGSALGDAAFDPYADLDGDRDVDAADAAILDATPCIADITGEGDVNNFDMSAFIALYGASDPSADLNADGTFDFFDVSTYLTMYGAGGCS